MNKVSSSATGARAMSGNHINFFSEDLAAPSAILKGMDKAARRICEVMPKSSSSGNDLATASISF